MNHREFLALLGHELRGPLGAITAAAEVLRSSAPDGTDACEARDVVQRQTQRMADALQTLLEVGRVVGGDTASTQRVDLVAMLREMQGFRLHSQVQDAWIETDRGLLEDALSKLSRSAGRPIEASIAGGGRSSPARVFTMQPVTQELHLQLVRALLERADAKVSFEAGAGSLRLVAELPP